MSSPSVGKVSLCGIDLDALTLGSLLELFDQARHTRAKLLILHHNLHSLYVRRQNPAFRSAYNLATHTYADGMPVIWLGKLAGLPLRTENRITYMDCFPRILAEAARRQWRVFYLGAKPGTLDNGLQALRKQFPDLLVEGHHGYFAKSGGESRQVIEQINSFQADVLFVGMGMPTQEIWIAEQFQYIEVPVITTCGATLEYFTGTSYKPPLWAGPLGLQWLFRLLSDPSRVWRRYLVEPFSLVGPLLTCIVRQRVKAR